MNNITHHEAIIQNRAGLLTEYSCHNKANVWRHYYYDMSTPAGMAKYVARTRYAWPGGYELYAITDDGGVLCHTCCRTEFWLIARSDPGDGWNVVAVTSTADCDMDNVYCDHCNRTIYEVEL